MAYGDRSRTINPRGYAEVWVKGRPHRPPRAIER